MKRRAKRPLRASVASCIEAGRDVEPPPCAIVRHRRVLMGAKAPIACKPKTPFAEAYEHALAPVNKHAQRGVFRLVMLRVRGIGASPALQVGAEARACIVSQKRWHNESPVGSSRQEEGGKQRLHLVSVATGRDKSNEHTL